MKTIDELGISPTPWKSTIGKMHLNQVWDNSNGQILSGGYTESVSDAHLIAAAPDMYEALRNMQECFDYIRLTAWFMDANFASIQKMTKAQNEAKSALAKASGEEAE